MLKKSVIISLLIILVLAVIAVIRFWSPEDTWICKNDQWIKHGNPEQSQPTTACNLQSKNNNERACADEATLCPDGSYVRRTGPNCEFVCSEVKNIIKK